MKKDGIMMEKNYKKIAKVHWGLNILQVAGKHMHTAQFIPIAGSGNSIQYTETFT